MASLISAGKVLTGPGGAELADGAVRVCGDRVVEVGRREELERTGPATMAFPESTVLPGLIDSHVHLAFDASGAVAATVQATDDDELFRGMADRARLLLECGVTTVRDLGDRGGLAVRVRDAIAAGSLAGPRIVAAGSPITVVGGHCWFLGGEVSGEQGIRDTVRRNVAAGAEVVKVMVTGGGMTPGGPAVWESQFGVEELRVVVDEARRAGLRIAAHAHGADGIADAVAAGVDTIEHCTWMSEGGFDVRPDLVERIVAEGIFVCPGASPGWRALPHVFGEQRAREMFDRIRWMAEAGVRLIAGTDAGVSGAVFDDFVGSLEFFAHLGLPPARVLDMATGEAAEAIGLSGETGQLVPGSRADLLVVDGDPLADLAALRDVRLVVAGGRAHTPTPAS